VSENTIAPRLGEAQNTIQETLRAVDQLMYDIVESDVSILTEASRHIISAGGKRVRPQILVNAYLAAGGKDPLAVVPLAAAIELVHTATLVHDDINDHGMTRRGRVTVNERWGRTFALLTGDFLFAKVYELMAPYGDLNKTFAEATVALVEGETLQAAAAKDGTLNREIYQKVVAKKTASLFRASAMLGAQLAHAERTIVETLGEFGFFLGLVFQVVDDLLDLIGDPLLMGKATQMDIDQGKGVAMAVAASRNGTGELAADAEEAQADDPFHDIKRRMIENGAIEEGREMAQMLSERAFDVLDRLPQGQPVENLRALMYMVLRRDR
jgi:octaprenyl-diphosphate synthase